MRKFILAMAFVCVSSIACVSCGSNANSNAVNDTIDTTVVDTLDTLADSVAVDSVVCPD